MNSIKSDPSGLSGLVKNRVIIIAVIAAAIVVTTILIAINAGINTGIVDPEPRTYPFASGITMGLDDAPVTMIEFSDFQCPFCRQFHEETLPIIIDTYVETGKVQFEFRNFAILGPNSFRAAKGALCATEQDSFWVYHDYLFANQNEGDPTAFTYESLEDLAGKAGLDVDKFRACLIDDRTHSQIDDDRRIAENAGATTTPSFLINGKLIRGAQSYEVFIAAIEASIASSN